MFAFKCRGFFTPFWWLRQENDEEIDDVDNWISCAACGGVNCHDPSRGQFCINSQMRITFHLQAPHMRVTPKEIIGEGKNYWREMFRMLGSKKYSSSFLIEKKLVKVFKTTQWNTRKP